MGALAMHAGWDGPGPWIGIAWLLVFAGAAAFFVLRAYRYRGRGLDHRRHGSAEAVLAERYARGEITEDQYRSSRAVLRDTDA